MATVPDDKIRIQAYIARQLRREAITSLRPGETLTELIEAAIGAEVERRKSASPGTGAPADVIKLPRGKRPKP